MECQSGHIPHCVQTSVQAYQLLKTFSMLSFAHSLVTQFWERFLKGKLGKRSCHLLIQSLQFSCLVVFDSLRHMDCSRPGFPVHHQLLELGSNLCPSSQWYCCGIRSHKTHLGGHSKQWNTVYYSSGFKGNQFPTKTLMFLGGPVLYRPLHEWLHGSNLFVVYDWVLQQIGARRTNN